LKKNGTRNWGKREIHKTPRRKDLVNIAHQNWAAEAEKEKKGLARRARSTGSPCSRRMVKRTLLQKESSANREAETKKNKKKSAIGKCNYGADDPQKTRTGGQWIEQLLSKASKMSEVLVA